MPVDISERLSEIISILSFLRVAEEWRTKPGHCAGLFRFEGKLLWIQACREFSINVPLVLQGSIMQDAMLKTLVATAAQFNLSFGITLAIPGGVITGQLISEKEFKARFAEDFTNALPGGPHDDLRETFSTLGEGIDGYEEVASSLIHLKDAKYVSHDGMLPNGGVPMYWRGKIEDVTGFSLGDLKRS